MLEFFRRNRGAFLIILTIVIIITFSVSGAWRYDKNAQVPQALPTDHAMTVFGKDYTNAEAGQVSRSLQFAMQHLSMFDLYIGLSSLGKQDGSNSGGGIVGTALVLQQLLEDTGIRASDAEAVEALKKLPNMQTNGVFDPSRGQQVEETAGMYGLNTADLLDIMRLKIGLEKLKELVTKNYAVSSLAAEKQYASSQQTMKVSTIAFDTEAFKKDLKVTDEEIQKAYDEGKENFKTVEKRAVKYVFFENPKDLDKVAEVEKRVALQKAVSGRLNAFTEKALAVGREANLEKLALPTVSDVVEAAKAVCYR
jgi:hypothetical protein